MIRLFCSCKINLGLRILRRLPDGYHELETLYYPLEWPRDYLFISKTAANSIHIRCDEPDIKQEDNLLTKAWTAYARATGYHPGLSIKLVKHIPAGAGLGGGSSNAACLLAWLNSQAPLPLPNEKLFNIAMRLGADVSFFLVGLPCLAGGIGENLQPVRHAGAGHYLVLVYPGIHISTAWAFKAWDEENGLTKAGAPARKTCSSVPDSPTNDLEQPVFASYPELAAIRADLLALGAEVASMSGSGSSIYGIFAHRHVAHSAASSLRKHWPAVYVQPMRNFGM